ncbi:hypothetical protein JZX87_14005 [Agrobacterium sp. Ap1]|uniref:hypothetical protein n=1 Tax=Agrobacterium sp. Ap1 TaxID=2815337 RepID=UPI001A8E9066|nr:hypothetical protein [Agrobacterium sp. Ap1]MBO0142276.1 hypothetical protein [Agrobacterium sp. Ap1]
MKTVTIKQLLNWAFVQELPKIGAPERISGAAAPSSWDVLSDVITLGTMVDKSPNMFGVVSSYIYEGEPHADAIMVGEAVKDLSERDFSIPAGWKPFPEWADERGLVRDEVARIVEAECGRGGRMNGRYIVQMVTTSAILGRGPDWTVDFEPKEIALTVNGSPAWFVMRQQRDRAGKLVSYEDNGYDQKKRRQKPGAYRKYKLDMPIRSAVVSRLEWQLWVSALESLHLALSGRLSDHDIMPFFPNRAPWATMEKERVDL